MSSSGPVCGRAAQRVLQPVRSPHDRAWHGLGWRMMPCAGLRGLLGDVRAPALLEARCSGKRRSPAISILLSTKHWRYRPRKFRGADRALPAGAEECARARPRLGVNEGTNDCDTRWPGLVHADAAPHRINLLARFAAGVVTSGQWFRHAEQGLTSVACHIRAAISVRIGRVDRLPQTAPCDPSGSCGSRPVLDWPRCLHG